MKTQKHHGRPKNPDRINEVLLHVAINKDLKAQLDADVRNEGRSLKAVVSRIIRKHYSTEVAS